MMRQPLELIDSRRIVENLRARLMDGSILMLAAAGLVLLAACAGR